MLTAQSLFAFTYWKIICGVIVSFHVLYVGWPGFEFLGGERMS